MAIHKPLTPVEADIKKRLEAGQNVREIALDRGTSVQSVYVAIRRRPVLVALHNRIRDKKRGRPKSKV